MVTYESSIRSSVQLFARERRVTPGASLQARRRWMEAS